jgi:hydroxycarboxylate dehydrogenase B
MASSILWGNWQQSTAVLHVGPDMPTLASAPLATLVRSLFVALGEPEASAQIVATSLVDANLCGHDSHGVMRAPQYIGFLQSGTYTIAAPFQVLHETPAVLTADGGWGLGQVQAHRLIERLIPKATTLGVATGTLRNCGHIGRLGEYAEVAATRKLAFFAAVNSHGAGRRVAPPGGTQGRISTNPICLGVPTSGEPVILDFGTSAVAEGKVRVHQQKGEAVPEGWLLDSNGQPTTDPGVLYSEPRGSIVPFGGQQAYKGFGLGLLLDMLCGGLSGGRCSHPNDPMAGVGNAVVFQVFDPALFGGTDHFVQQATGLADYVRATPTVPGTQITLPGDPERQTKTSRLLSGIPIPDATWKLLTDAARQLNVTVTI